jgi:hypothetical protein
MPPIASAIDDGSGTDPVAGLAVVLSSAKPPLAMTSAELTTMPPEVYEPVSAVKFTGVNDPENDALVNDAALTLNAKLDGA